MPSNGRRRGMLRSIHIRDFAIIDALDIDLAGGMTALTGETGAGKSIVVDALALALGDRADASVIRSGAGKAEISVMFDVGNFSGIKDWLADHDLVGEGHECLVRRSVVRDGRSRGFVNGSPVPMQSLRELGEMLVDIHGQHEHQSLLRPEMQRQLLDLYGRHGTILAEVGAAYQRWRAAREELARLAAGPADVGDRIQLLEYQLAELDRLGLREGELEGLEQEHARLAHATQLIEAGSAVLDSLTERDQACAVDALEAAVRTLGAQTRHDARFAPVSATLEQAAIHAREAAMDLRHLIDEIDIDPERLSSIEQRLSAIHDLARKHRVSPDDLPAVQQRLGEMLHELRDVDRRAERLVLDIEDAAQAWLRTAIELTRRRRASGEALAKQVTRNMEQLGMAGGSFAVVLHERVNSEPAPMGAERVEFRVAANPGQPVGPLQKVASGGELSRISLAIQVVNATGVAVPTLVFDEVDVGIGGGVAEIVGRQLHALATARQVICVTHLPQVAAQADEHYGVRKRAVKGTMRVDVERLDAPARRNEIGRMLGGLEITEQTLAHAAEMIDRAQARSNKSGRPRRRQPKAGQDAG